MKPNVVAVMLRGALAHRGWSQKELAMRTELTPKHVCRVLQGQDGVSVDVALRFELALGVPARVLIDLQSAIDLRAARRKLRLQKKEKKR